ncbi:response regulator [Pseudomonas veronii]|jgi:two-component system secretion response regulator SsrB|uniref:response regulator n=1 Tax=Pseudomonas TaxID=286 RepID=UPI0009A5334E|nr:MULTISPECIES: response regulator [Pseudomonas]AQY66422.1 DNA-binding response regulator [Pseudomonas veronii]MCT9822856.1 response regulator [Pseudomonas veronii]NMX36398.1 response regulator [Pseudomonas veronii]NWD58223.1 response regulator [Pseudomonas veronii]PUB37622.1 LuxR family two component transcriptional regulator [Pseudomonas sp. GV105]
MPECRLLLVDDHAMIREGLCALLADVPELNVAGEAEDGQQAVAMCRALQPDLVLMDLNMPLLDGVSALTLIARRWPAILIIALTSTVSEHNAALALEAGAVGYVLKRSRREDLLQAIAQVRAGRIYIDAGLDAAQVMALRGAGHTASGVGLTGRERQVLKLVAEGARNRDVAEILCIGLKTVETHRLNLMKKLDAHNAADMTQWAYRLGLLGEDQ